MSLFPCIDCLSRTECRRAGACHKRIGAHAEERANSGEPEFAVFVLVRVRAANKATAEEAVSTVLGEAMKDDTEGLEPLGIVTDYEVQDVIAS